MEQVPRARAGFLDPVLLGAENRLRLIHRVSPQLDVTALAPEYVHMEGGLARRLGWRRKSKECFPHRPSGFPRASH